MTKNLTIIVKSYQRPWLLKICLESIKHFLRTDTVPRIVIADDGTDPKLLRKAESSFGHLWDVMVHSEEGEAKWNLCEEGRFSEVVPTCGTTWNRALEYVDDHIFLIEDDSFLDAPFYADAAMHLLDEHPEYLCFIGLRERCLYEIGKQPYAGIKRAVEGVEFLQLEDTTWPFSFDGLFYRRSQIHDVIGLWPPTLPTGPMEGWIVDKFKQHGLYGRPVAIALNPFCKFDSNTSVRTDHPSTYAKRFAHVDKINDAWRSGIFDPSFTDVLIGRLFGTSNRFDPCQLHYPRGLWQAEFCEGWELNHLAPDPEKYRQNILRSLEQKYYGGHRGHEETSKDEQETPTP